MVIVHNIVLGLVLVSVAKNLSTKILFYLKTFTSYSSIASDL